MIYLINFLTQWKIKSRLSIKVLLFIGFIEGISFVITRKTGNSLNSDYIKLNLSLLIITLSTGSSPAKSSLLDFSNKNSFSFFFAGEKTLVHVYEILNLFFQFFYFALLQAKNEFRPSRPLRRWSETKIDSFWEAHYIEANAVEKILFRSDF